MQSIALRVLPSVIALALLAPVDLLDLSGVRLGPGVPPGWQVRPVRGQQLPETEVARDGDWSVLRIRGAGRAAWFYRQLDKELAESAGALQWSWRVLAAPADADLRIEERDDAPIRVFVVFGTPGVFRRSARILFYTFGNAEPSGFERPSFTSDKLHIIRVDGVAEHGSWRGHAVRPFADYRRIWKGAPPGITAVGVMQDTDQTRAQANAEIRQLAWVPDSTVPPADARRPPRQSATRFRPPSLAR